MFNFKRNAKLPEPVWEPELSEFSPDIWKLEQYETQRIFVADSSLDGLLREATDIAEPIYQSCYTFMPYTLWRKDLGKDHTYSVILPGTYRPTGFVRWPVESFPVHGRVWDINPKQFILLDKARQNGLQFRRERIPISYPLVGVRWNRKAPIPKAVDHHIIFDAWAYIGIPEYWDTQIGGVFARSQLEVIDAPARLHKRFYKFE